MRILFLSHYFPPEGNAPASRTFAHCKRWVAAGHDVTVLTCVPNHPKGVVYAGYRNHLRRVEDVEGIRVVRVFTYLAANAGTWGRIANYLLYMLAAVFFGFFERRPDVVIATSPQFFCGWAGVLLATFRRLPFLLEIRDLWPGVDLCGRGDAIPKHAAADRETRTLDVPGRVAHRDGGRSVPEPVDCVWNRSVSRVGHHERRGS